MLNKECPWCKRNVELLTINGFEGIGKALGNWVFGGPRTIVKDIFTHGKNIHDAVKYDDPVLNAIEKEWKCSACRKYILECGYCGKLHKWDDKNFRVCSCGARV